MVKRLTLDSVLTASLRLFHSGEPKPAEACGGGSERDTASVTVRTGAGRWQRRRVRPALESTERTESCSSDSLSTDVTAWAEDEMPLEPRCSGLLDGFEDAPLPWLSSIQIDELQQFRFFSVR
ncbi:hypothetical protein LIA77_01362 [Sarocladium implicatum]|nr:hypothetical protein LIA77_01362 [Sarocladium implicatum]